MAVMTSADASSLLAAFRASEAVAPLDIKALAIGFARVACGLKSELHLVKAASNSARIDNFRVLVWGNVIALIPITWGGIAWSISKLV